MINNDLLNIICLLLCFFVAIFSCFVALVIVFRIFILFRRKLYNFLSDEEKAIIDPYSPPFLTIPFMRFISILNIKANDTDNIKKVKLNLKKLVRLLYINFLISISSVILLLILF